MTTAQGSTKRSGRENDSTGRWSADVVLKRYRSYAQQIGTLPDKNLALLILRLTSKCPKQTVALRLWRRLKEKTKNTHILRALDVVIAQPEGTLRKLPIVTKFKEALQNLPKA